MEIYVNRQRLEAPKVFFSSDWHLGHDNIIKHCDRPFKNSKEMDDTIIDRCNESIFPEDILFYLGDFCFHNKYRDKCNHEELAYRYRDRIACKNIFFVWGNHDKKLRGNYKFQNLWQGTYDLLPVEVDGQKIVLCHYAMRTWDKSHHAAWHLYGHSHGDLEEDPKSLSFDVGSDPNDFWPLDFGYVRDKMKTKIDSGAGPSRHHN